MLSPDAASRAGGVEVWFTAIGQVSTVDAPEVGEPGPGEALVAMIRVGLCGSDVHVLHGRHPFTKPPVITGHEAVAEVIAVGDGVDHSLVGQRALINPLVVTTEWTGDWRTASNIQEDDVAVMGFKLPGLARSRAIVPAKQLHRIDRDLDPSAAVLAEPLAAGLHAARRPRGRLEDVLIIGGGPIGQCVLLGVLAEGGGHVTLVEPVESKRSLALRLGATNVVAPDDAPLAEKRFTTVFDCVSSPSTLRSAVGMTRGGGCVVVMGVPSASEWSLPMPRMQRYEIDLIGSGMYTADDIDDAIRIITANPDAALSLVSAVYPASKAAEAFETTSRPDSVKTLLAFDGDQPT